MKTSDVLKNPRIKNDLTQDEMAEHFRGESVHLILIKF